jgi:hypothetical protein
MAEDAFALMAIPKTKFLQKNKSNLMRCTP